jgi:zinc protease
LAYSVWSYFTGGDSGKGAFMIGGETKSSTTYEFISLSRDLMRRVAENGISSEELESAKEAVTNSFIFAFDKNSDVVGKYLWIEYFNMPGNYLETFRDDIQAVTMEKVKATAARLLHPDNILIVAVGDRGAIGDQLNKFGAVTGIEPKK